MLQTSHKILVILVLSFLTSSAYAGGCYIEEVTPGKASASIKMAKLVRSKVLEIEKAMNKKGENLKVVLLARSGESMNGFDILKDNPEVALQEYLDYLATTPEAKIILDKKMKYSHIAFYLKRDTEDCPGDEDWKYVVHLLAECDKASNRYGSSDIFNQPLPEFFWDTKLIEKKQKGNRTLIAVPSAALQERIFHILANKRISEQGLHTLKYNVAAAPFTLRSPKKIGQKPPMFYQPWDQNSNQWPLEVMAAATKPFDQIRNRYDAQDQLLATNYRPSLLRPTGIKESNACALNKGTLFWIIPLWDATNLLNCTAQVYRNNGILQIITVDSVLDYLIQNQLMAENISKPEVAGTYELSLPAKSIENSIAAGKVIEKLIKKVKAQDSKKKRICTPEGAIAG